MYAVGVVKQKIQTNLGLEVNLNECGMVGMMPVFKTMEAAKEAFPDNDIIGLDLIGGEND